MAALLKKIQHIQLFLKGVQALESFEKLREDQFKQCSDFISGSKGLSLESVSSILGVLDASVWNAEQLRAENKILWETDAFDRCLRAPKREREPSPPKQKASGQDYRNLVYHLKPCNYETLANSKPDCLQALALHAATLGLRNPSEGTLLIFAIHGGSRIALRHYFRGWCIGAVTTEKTMVGTAHCVRSFLVGQQEKYIVRGCAGALRFVFQYPHHLTKNMNYRIGCGGLHDKQADATAFAKFATCL